MNEHSLMGNQIHAAMILTGSDFVSLDADKQPEVPPKGIGRRSNVQLLEPVLKSSLITSRCLNVLSASLKRLVKGLNLH